MLNHARKHREVDRSLLRYAEEAVVHLDDGELLGSLFARLESEISPPNVSALALFAYCLSLRHNLLRDHLAIVEELVDLGNSFESSTETAKRPSRRIPDLWPSNFHSLGLIRLYGS